jgi:uncharacterized protein (UPF0333 family)
MDPLYFKLDGWIRSNILIITMDIGGVSEVCVASKINVINLISNIKQMPQICVTPRVTNR